MNVTIRTEFNGNIACYFMKICDFPPTTMSKQRNSVENNHSNKKTYCTKSCSPSSTSLSTSCLGFFIVDDDDDDLCFFRFFECDEPSSTPFKFNFPPRTAYI